MKTNYDELLQKITDFLKNETKTETVVGREFKLGEFTCVPVIRLGLGFGFGGGEAALPNDKAGRTDGSGGGAGMGIEPMGFLVTRGAEVNFVSTKTSKGLSAAFEKMPELLQNYLQTRQHEVPAV